MKYSDKFQELFEYAKAHCERNPPSSYRLKVSFESEYLRVAALEPFGDGWAENGIMITVSPRLRGGKVALLIHFTATVAAEYKEAKPRLSAIARLERLAGAFASRLKGVELEP